MQTVVIDPYYTLSFAKNKGPCRCKALKDRNKATNGSNPQFYRFDKQEDDNFPKMIELFCRSDFKLKDAKGIIPIHIDDEVSSLSAILLNDDYYKARIERTESDGI